MKEVNPACLSWLRRWVVGYWVWCASSCAPRRRRPRPRKSLFEKGIGGSLVVYRPILERWGPEFWIDTTAMVVGLVEETEENRVTRSLCRSDGVTGALGLSVPLWGPMFDLTGNYVLGVLLVPKMLILIRLVTGTLEDLSLGVGQRLCLKWLVWGKGVSTPLLRRTLYPDSWRSCVNVGRMDLAVIQYWMVRVGLPNDDAWRMLVLDSNTCSWVRSLGIVDWSRSAIVTTGAVAQRNCGKYAAVLEIHPLLPQSIRAITFRRS